MAGLEPFGFNSQSNSNSKLQKVNSILDDKDTVDELSKLSESIKTDCKSSVQIIFLTRKKKALEALLKEVSKELENFKPIFIKELEESGKKNYQSGTGQTVYKVNNTSYAASPERKLAIAREEGREELITVNSKDFNSLCNSIFKSTGKTPEGVSKSTFLSINVRGI